LVRGRVFRSDSTSWEELPEDGALAFALCESTCSPDGNHTRQVMSGYDWYFKAGDVYGSNNHGEEEKPAPLSGGHLQVGPVDHGDGDPAVLRAQTAETFNWI
jgi:hypothetical protein